MMKFTGNCVGGPLDKKCLAHWQRSKKFYRPMIAMTMNIENAPVETVEIGEYRLNDFGQWHWRPTASGRAFDKLFGKIA